VRILTGAPVPPGADAVVSEEFTRVLPGAVDALDPVGSGQNILPVGADIRRGQLLVSAGQYLSPTIVGLLSAAGLQRAPVVRRPRVAVLATGDELLAPGQPFVQGKLYASNMYTLANWCLHYGFGVETYVLQDDENAIREALTACLEQNDAVLTSGGTWKGEHDLVVYALDALGWQKVYHRVRIGPGKSVAFGTFRDKPVFCLPGGPPSNHMAFLQLGLPGLQKLAGDPHPGLPQAPAVLAETITGRGDWTQFVHGKLIRDDQRLVFQPMKYQSRLQEMAQAEAVAMIPEGQDSIPTGSSILVQVLYFKP
jgi:molybdopterin molybdotransferase